jgi:hypothetical protein
MRRLPSLSSKRAVLPSSAPRPARRRPTGGRATSFVKVSGSSDWRTWWQMRHLAALLPPPAPFSRVSSWRHVYRSLLAVAPARLFATLARSGVPARPSLPLRCGCRALPRASVGRGSLAGSLRSRALSGREPGGSRRGRQLRHEPSKGRAGPFFPRLRWQTIRTVTYRGWSHRPGGLDSAPDSST